MHQPQYHQQSNTAVFCFRWEYHFPLLIKDAYFWHKSVQNSKIHFCRVSKLSCIQLHLECTNKKVNFHRFSFEHFWRLFFSLKNGTKNTQIFFVIRIFALLNRKKPVANWKQNSITWSVVKRHMMSMVVHKWIRQMANQKKKTRNTLSEWEKWEKVIQQI